jgi:Peptidase family M23
MPRLARTLTLLTASAAAIALLCGAVVAQAGSPAGAAAPDRAPAAHVFAAPTAVPATDGRRHLAYEVVLENGTRGALRLDRLDVRDPDRATSLATYRGRALADLVVRLDGKTGTRKIPGKTLAVLPLDVVLAPGRPVPARLVNRVSVSPTGAAGNAQRVTTTAATRVRRRAPLRVAPPLHGGSLLVLGCCGRPFAHRLAATTRSPRSALPVFAQRYAIDFLRLDAQASTFSGDPKQNASYLIYGAEVVAAAPGRIVATRNDMPENTPPDPRPGIGPNDLAGNFVNQDLGGSRFALYGHMQPGSLRVKPGDQVVAGQVLGLVGNSGNSSEPHLHFHVTDAAGGASNLGAEGIPYVFSAFGLEGRLAGLATDPPAPRRVPARPPVPRTAQYPLTGDVVAFP